jgi:hypothetical protein
MNQTATRIAASIGCGRGILDTQVFDGEVQRIIPQDPGLAGSRHTGFVSVGAVTAVRRALHMVKVETVLNGMTDIPVGPGRIKNIVGCP